MHAYDREEIGISIDDMDNLRILDAYVHKVIRSSKHYGVSFPPIDGTVTTKITRGWLYEEIVREFAHAGMHRYDTYSSHSFLNGIFGTISTSDIMKTVASDLAGFYVKVILAYLESEIHSDEQRLEYLRRRFGFCGSHRIDEILEFLESRLARSHMPRIPPIAEFVPRQR